MSNRTLTILAVLAAITLVAAIVADRATNAVRATADQPRPLIQGLDPAQIDRIDITENNETVTLNRTPDGFAIAEKAGYPANTSAINDLLRSCLAVQVTKPITDNPDNYADLGITEQDARSVVRFYREAQNASDNADAPTHELITGLVVGSSASTAGGSYVRLVNQNPVYTSAEPLYLRTGATAYLDQQLLDLDQDKIRAVAVNAPAGSYTLVADPNGGIGLIERPQDRPAKPDILRQVFNAPANLRFQDVLPASEFDPAVPFGYEITATLDDATVYTLSLAQNKEKYYLRLSAKFLGPGRVTVSRTEGQEELEKKAAQLTAAQTAQELTEKHKNWVYEIGAWKYNQLTKPLSDLLEAPPAPEPPAEESPMPQEPEPASTPQ